ncbi:MAG: hypothetical protein NT151_12240 [Acidobacteria bacterium]|nr:hypothetical protein [Acidobacteriota bacterium]
MKFSLSTSTIIVVVLFNLAGCGGKSSSPSAPTPTPTTLTATLTIASVSPATITSSATSQTIIVTGTNFLSGLTLTNTAPGGGTTTLGGSQIQDLTTTSFQVSATFAELGSYGLQVANPSGSASGKFAVVTGQTITLTGRVFDVFTSAPQAAVARSRSVVVQRQLPLVPDGVGTD